MRTTPHRAKATVAAVLLAELVAAGGQAAVGGGPETRASADALLQEWRVGDRNSRVETRLKLAREFAAAPESFLESLGLRTRHELAVVFRLIEDGRFLGAAPELTSLLRSDPRTEVRVRATVVLGRIGASSSAALICSLVEEGSDSELQSAAIYAIGLLPEASCEKEVAQQLDNADAAVRLQAAWALARRGDTRGESTILQASRENSGIDRRYAVEALGDLATGEAQARLVEIIENREPWAGHAHLGLLSIQIRGKSASYERRLLLELAARGQRLESEWALCRLAMRGDGSLEELLQNLGSSGGDRTEKVRYLMAVRGSAR